MAGRFEIRWSLSVREDLRALRAYDRRLMLTAIEQQLAHSPHVATRQRKRLHNLVPPFEAVPPVWQLRVGALRVFYDVQENDRRVYVRAIRHKPAHQSTEEIL